MSLEDNNYCYILSSDDANLEQVKYDPDSPRPPNIGFVVHIHANITQVPIKVMEEEEEDGVMLIDEYETHNFYKSFETKSDLLVRVDDYESYSNISHMLSDVSVPQYAHPGMIREISNAAWSIAAAKRNANCSSLTMIVLVGAVGLEEPEDVMDYGINEEADEAMVEDIRQGFAEKVSIST